MFLKIFAPALIFLLVSVLAVVNLSPQNWLIGWDNLHPEFNFGMNIKRSVYAVWQEYQGLGLLGGMGHASDLPRQLLLAFSSLFLPINLIRPSFFFLMLLLGPLGVYFLLERTVLKKVEEGTRKIASFFGAVFYLLNLATIQAFYVPFSPFLVHYAFLPWLIFSLFLFLEKQNFRRLVFFVSINLLAVPQAYVPTLFFVYLLVFGTVLLVLLTKNRLRGLGAAVKATLLTLAINAFWLLPFLYFVSSNVNIPFEAKISQMATEDNLLRNLEFGDLDDVIVLRGFWFNNSDLLLTGEYGYMMEPWRQHFTDPLVWAVGALLFTIVLLGAIYSIKERNPYIEIFLLLFLIAFTFLANDTPPFSWVDSMLYRIPAVAQALRFPFTKFSLLAALSYSVFFAFGVAWIIRSLNWVPKVGGFLKGGFLAASLGLLIFLTLPAFQGGLFYDKLELRLPSEYKELFKFFEEESQNTRIANFPQHTFWGWSFYNWGYGGSGFLWYGIKQPILDRAFDVWSREDENYYWEASYALYSQDKELFKDVLEKYQINWILVDKNVVNSPSPKALYFDELEDILNSSDKIVLEREFGNIRVYRTKLETPVRNFVFQAQDLTEVGPDYKWGNYDYAFAENGHYITSHQSPVTSHQLIYPFRTLFTGKTQRDMEFEVEDEGEAFVFRSRLSENLEDYTLYVPQTNQELIWVNPLDLSDIRYLSPEVSYNGDYLEVTVPKVGGYLAGQMVPAEDFGFKKPKNCNRLAGGKIQNKVIKENGRVLLRLASENATNCSVSFWLPNQPNNIGYLVSIESRNVSGRGIIFWNENINNRKANLESYLPQDRRLKTYYFVQPPMEEGGVGYSLHFDSVSIGKEKTINDLGEITINPISYRFLTQLSLRKSEAFRPVLKAVEVAHPNESLYEVQTSGSGVIILSQAYHQGWQAYYLNSGTPSFLAPVLGKKVGEHVLVNNWANGWRLGEQPEGEKLVILFVPQYLEYTGLALLGIIIGYMLMRRFV